MKFLKQMTQQLTLNWIYVKQFFVEHHEIYQPIKYLFLTDEQVSEVYGYSTPTNTTIYMPLIPININPSIQRTIY
jgi:hypothetical protein